MLSLRDLSCSPEVAATSVLSAGCVASDDILHQPGWRRPRGRRRISWLHQVCTDLDLPTPDSLNIALDLTAGQAVATASRLCVHGDDGRR